MSSAELEETARAERAFLAEQRRAHPEMRASSQRLLVGYRDDDPRRHSLGGDIAGGLEGGRCADCKHPVYFDPSGIRCIRDRDPVIACMFCQDHFRYVERIHQSGMVVQL